MWSLVVVLVALLLAGPGTAAAKVLIVEPIPPSIPGDLDYGEILREVRVEGNKYTREWVIRSAIKSQIGFPYTYDNARLDLLWVLRLGAFTSVSLATEPVDDGIALIIAVVESTPYIPSLSIGLTQENGLEIGPAFSSSNFLGTAARASAYVRFGGAFNAGIRYADPMLPGRSWLHGHTFSYFHRDRTNKLVEFEETTDEFYFEFRQAPHDFARNGIRFRYIALKSDRDGVTLGSDNYDHIPSLGLFVQADSRNSIYPTDGWYADIEVSKYFHDADYWRFDADVRFYRPLPLFGDRHSLALSSYAALTAGVLGETIPPWSEFYIGGTNSVRGWSMGSRQGHNQWLNTIEYWFQLMEQKRWKFWFIKWRMGLQIGAFGDFGTAWSEPDQLDANWIGGGGLGLRLTLPVVTMFRMDLAWGEDSMGIRFFVGGSEKAIAQKNRVR